MTLIGLISSSLRYHLRTNLAVALAVVATTAVLTGALLVGDSMRGSLRHLILDQLGSIDEVLITDRFFRADLAQQVAHSPDVDKYFSTVVPAVLVQGTIERPQTSGTARAAGVTVLGADERFWKLGSGGAVRVPRRNEIVLNAPLAAELGITADDLAGDEVVEVLLRVGSQSEIPPDNPLGRKTETIRNRRLRVAAIIPAEGLGRFGLSPNQQQPLNAYVDAEQLAEALEQPGKANTLFVSGKPGIAPTAAAHDALQSGIRPTLADFGLEVKQFALGYEQVSSGRMLLEPAALAAIKQAFAGAKPQELFTYLANTIAAGDRQIPYSTITAIDFAAEPPLGPFRTPAGKIIGPLADDEIVLNTWAAKDLGAEPGAMISVTYFEPESTHGEVREKTAAFRLKEIVALEGMAADPDLTPQLPGVTDRLNMGDWDAPFPFDAGRVRKVDDEYWAEYRTTPKAFVSLTTGRRLWSSRFGETTAVRFAPSENLDAAAAATALLDKLQSNPAKFGFEFRPIKAMGLAAASGTTPFDGLFLGFSFFLMIASLLLVALLFRLGVEQRAAEVGILRAVGMGLRRVGRALAGEGFIVSALGAAAGVALGVGYAALMLAGLGTWWLAAISTPFLRLHVSMTSLMVGFAASLLVSLVTIVWSLRRLRRVSVRRLLSGQAEPQIDRAAPSRRILPYIMAALIVLALLSAASAPWLRDEAKAGAFVGAGALVLAVGLCGCWMALGRGSSLPLSLAATAPLSWLAIRSGSRNPSRSTLSVGLLAAASFLIIALSAFRLDPASQGSGPESGSGGYDLAAQSAQPIYQDLSTPAGRRELAFSRAAESRLAMCPTMAFRVRAGDDASCLNLFQVTQPRVLGASADFIARGGFAWAGSAAKTPAERRNPWLLLEDELPAAADGTPVVPMILDFNTAMYSLHKGRIGDTLEIADGRGGRLRLQIAGLLKNSLFQGDVLISEQEFLKYFPLVSGYRFFLVDARAAGESEVSGLLEDRLGDFGFDATPSQARMEAFFAVQNTYLSTFQSLGGLGLLLGTFGLAAVQLRSVLERRGELALMRAVGFARWRLARMVLIEHALLLMAGLAIGVLAALVAVLPHWVSGGARVPWQSLAAILLVVLAIGMLAGLAGVRAVLRAPLLPALRRE